jgi:hypothetical protein
MIMVVRNGTSAAAKSAVIQQDRRAVAPCFLGLPDPASKDCLAGYWSGRKDVEVFVWR